MNEVITIAPWLDAARREIGVHEISGLRDNARIMKYASLAHVHDYDHDEVPWCAVFACAMLEKTGYKSTRSAWARDFLKCGTGLKTPVVGCIAILERGQASGHVGFVTQIQSDRLMLLGGNQADSVCEAWVSRRRVLGYRWPTANEVPLSLTDLAPQNIAKEPQKTEEWSETEQRLRDIGSRTVTNADVGQSALQQGGLLATLAYALDAAVDYGRAQLDKGSDVLGLLTQVHGLTQFAKDHIWLVTAVVCGVAWVALHNVKFARVDDQRSGAHK